MSMFSMPKITASLVLGLILAGAGALSGGADAASALPVDFSGLWVPATRPGDALAPDKLHMTERGKAALAAFDPRHHDSTRFCMPYGTPRNTLSTAPYPLEIVQRPE